MRIGIQFDLRGHSSLESILADFVRAEEDGFDAIWSGQVFDHDILTLLALAGPRTMRIELGTSVVPLPTRHPTVLAQQALTAQLATGGRLCLGVGSGHAAILGKKLGLPDDLPLARTREALEVLLPLLRGEYVKYEGDHQQVRVGTPIVGAGSPPVLLAALGPRMIELAGELTAGVSVVFAGTRFIAERVRPHLPDDARIVACLPVLVTDAVVEARATVDTYTAPSTALAAYQRTLGSQGIEGVSDISLIGSAAELEDELDALAAAGVTDLNPILIPTDADRGCGRRTREFLAERARRRRSSGPALTRRRGGREELD